MLEAGESCFESTRWDIPASSCSAAATTSGGDTLSRASRNSFLLHLRTALLATHGTIC